MANDGIKRYYCTVKNMVKVETWKENKHGGHGGRKKSWRMVKNMADKRIIWPVVINSACSGSLTLRLI